MPSSVLVLLDGFDSLITLGLPIILLALECFGARDFAARLTFFFFFPFFILALLLGGHCLRTLRTDSKAEHQLKPARTGSSTLEPSQRKTERKVLSAHQSAGRSRPPLRLLLQRSMLAALPSATRFLFMICKRPRPKHAQRPHGHSTTGHHPSTARIASTLLHSRRRSRRPSWLPLAQTRS